MLAGRDEAYRRFTVGATPASSCVGSPNDARATQPSPLLQSHLILTSMIPTSTDVSVQVKDNVPANAEAVIVFATEEAKESGLSAGLSREESAAVRRLFASGVARGRAKEVVFDLVEGPRKKTFRRIIVAGVGKAEKVSSESIRQAAGGVIRVLRKHRLSRAAVLPPGLATVEADAAAGAVVTGMLLRAFDYREYKGIVAAGKKGDADDDRPRRLDVTMVGEPSALRTPVERARIIADGQNFARTIASRPG